MIDPERPATLSQIKRFESQNRSCLSWNSIPQPTMPISPAEGNRKQMVELSAETRSLALHWLQTKYKTKSGSIVPRELLILNLQKAFGQICPAHIGRMVKTAFPNISQVRKGPRGATKRQYVGIISMDAQDGRSKRRMESCPKHKGKKVDESFRTLAIKWMQCNYTFKNGEVTPRKSLISHFQAIFGPVNHAQIGMMVRKAFPQVEIVHKGPRGLAKRQYKNLLDRSLTSAGRAEVEEEKAPKKATATQTPKVDRLKSITTRKVDTQNCGTVNSRNCFSVLDEIPVPNMSHIKIRTTCLELQSPVNSYPLYLEFTIGDRKHQDEGGPDIVQTITWVCEEFPELKRDKSLSSTLQNVDFFSVDNMTFLVHVYNQAIGRAKMAKVVNTSCSKGASQTLGLLRHIMEEIYKISVTDTRMLRRYKSFSAEVYGETTFEQVVQMVEAMRLKKNDVFIDLGSGVGHVVLLIAALTRCSLCLGIEKAEAPSAYASQMDVNFRRWMEFFGKGFSKFNLIKGNFLEEEYSSRIKSSSIIFVNNFAFGPTLNQDLAERFLQLKEGSKIISTVPFGAKTNHISKRNFAELSSIVTMTTLEPFKNNVSWTNSHVPFYLHVIDRDKLKRYFKNKTATLGYKNICSIK